MSTEACWRVKSAYDTIAGATTGLPLNDYSAWEEFDTEPAATWLYPN